MPQKYIFRKRLNQLKMKLKLKLFNLNKQNAIRMGANPRFK